MYYILYFIHYINYYINSFVNYINYYISSFAFMSIDVIVKYTIASHTSEIINECERNREVFLMFDVYLINKDRVSN